MKRTILAIAMIMIASISWAQYVVTEVTGRVDQEVTINKWESITRDQRLRSDSVIRTGIGARLTIRNESTSEVHIINGGKVGMIMDILSDTISGTIQISGTVTRVDTSVRARTTGQVSTASARASDAASELELEE